MSTTHPLLVAPADAELISAVRGGDADAYGELFSRHFEAARRLARQLVPGSDADDLVSEAFAKVLAVLQRGGGPDLAFRAYLLTSIRRLHVDRVRASARLTPTDDVEAMDTGVPFRDTAVEGFENAAAARAFGSLPERWQMVLWHTEVEGQKPADIAPLLGMSPNSVSALAYRAREGLRQAFLTMHVQELDDATCEWTHQVLGAYVRNGLARRDREKVERHIEECRTCMAIYLELTEVNANLSGLLAPVVLGGAATAYAASATGGLAVKGGVLVLLDRARDLVAANAPASAVAGVAATAVVGSALFVAVDRDRPGEQRTADPPAATTQMERGADGRPDPAPRDRNGPPDSGRDQTPFGPAAPGPTQLAPIVGTPIEQPNQPPVPPPDDQPDPPDAPPVDPSPDPPSPHPEPPPTKDPHPPPPDPAPVGDLSVWGTATPIQGHLFRVVVNVAGLAEGETATLLVTAEGTTAALAFDDRCQSVAIRDGSRCSVTHTPTTFEFTAGAVPPRPAAMVFTVVPDGDQVDPDATNNQIRIPLTS